MFPNCQICQEPRPEGHGISNPGFCSNCWEVDRRLADFSKHPGGRKRLVEVGAQMETASKVATLREANGITGGTYVRVTSFKPSGKYAYSGIYLSQSTDFYEIRDEVEKMQRTWQLPGLLPGSFYSDTQTWAVLGEPLSETLSVPFLLPTTTRG